MTTLPALRSTLLPQRAHAVSSAARGGHRDELVVVGHFALRRTSTSEYAEHGAEPWVEVPEVPRMTRTGARATPVEVPRTEATPHWEHRAMTPLPTEGYLALHTETLPLRSAAAEGARTIRSAARHSGYGRIANADREREGLGLAASF